MTRRAPRPQRSVPCVSRRISSDRNRGQIAAARARRRNSTRIRAACLRADDGGDGGDDDRRARERDRREPHDHGSARVGVGSHRPAWSWLRSPATGSSRTTAATPARCEARGSGRERSLTRASHGTAARRLPSPRGLPTPPDSHSFRCLTRARWLLPTYSLFRCLHMRSPSGICARDTARQKCSPPNARAAGSVRSDAAAPESARHCRTAGATWIGRTSSRVGPGRRAASRDDASVALSGRA